MDKKFIIYFLILFFSKFNFSYSENNTVLDFDKGIISLMYHRFEENKYPSTNIRLDIFKEQINYIKKSNFTFLNPVNLKDQLSDIKEDKLILLTIDDGFQSFYDNAWPILKKNKIPFILFISTEFVGKNNYMSWEQILEIEKSGLGKIGNHSHSHEYLADWSNEEIKKDLNKSINLFKKNLGYSPKYFSYPFGEYSNDFKEIVKELNFEIAFGQHSGIIDASKNKLELPRFPINEKYGDLDRFKFILNLLPLPYKKIDPENRYLQNDENPPKIEITFFEEQKNLEKINCFSNEGNRWRKSKIEFIKNNRLKIIIDEKFVTERGRINCSLQDKKGWRWLGIQYVISEY